MCPSLIYMSFSDMMICVWLVLSFVIVLGRYGCHGYTACLKFIACGFC